jgi:hypothetical protein
MVSLKDWIESIWGSKGQIQAANQTMPAFTAIESLDNYYKALPDDVKNDATVKALYTQRQIDLKDQHIILEDPIKAEISKLLTKWKDKVAAYDLKDPSKAQETLSELAAYVLEVSGGVFAIELALGAAPFTEGTVAKAKVSELMAWLGFGAVVTAVAHDPVKIGLLRPYQDSLEATFRNRRPGDMQLFQAYRTRELTPTKVEDLNLLNDEKMNVIEAENQKFYDREISKWGYSEWFAGALARSATRTLNFSQLVTLARAGIYDKGLAIYSLWGEGLDRVVMPQALKAIETLRDREMYSGFRSMIEPSYVEGDIPETDLVTYWNLAGVPEKVQNWVLPRLKKRREAYVLKQKTGAAVKERDLTASQIQSAYQNNLLDRARAQNDILTLGYSLDEARILLDLAELRRKLPSAQTLKRLPLTDYEKAYKNGLIDQAAVLDRMRGEYTAADIELERKLLEIGEA